MRYDATGGTIDGQPTSVATKVVGPDRVWVDGSVDPPTSVNFGVTDTIPVREGYAFLFWRDASFFAGGDRRAMYRGSASTPSQDESPLGESGRYVNAFELQDDEGDSTCSDPTLYAVWDKTCSLSYDAAGGATTPETQRSTFGVDWGTGRSHTEKDLVAAAAPVREGYAFKGWRATDGTVRQPGDTVTLTTDRPDETLTALWEAKPDTNEPGGGGTDEPGKPDEPDNPGEPNKPDNPGEPPAKPDNPGIGDNPGTGKGSGDDPSKVVDKSSGNGGGKSASASRPARAKSALPKTGDATLAAPALLGGSGILATIAAAALRRRRS